VFEIRFESEEKEYTFEGHIQIFNNYRQETDVINFAFYPNRGELMFRIGFCKDTVKPTVKPLIQAFAKQEKEFIKELRLTF